MPKLHSLKITEQHLQPLPSKAFSMDSRSELFGVKGTERYMVIIFMTKLNLFSIKGNICLTTVSFIMEHIVRKM